MGCKKLRGVIAIDGPSGAGKSTVARRLAERLGIQYLDTGALYRAVGLWLHGQAVPVEDSPRLARLLENLDLQLREGRVILEGRDVTDGLRSEEVGLWASQYGALPSVRDALMDLQRNQALHGPLVADGRDMGTVVFPLAPLKVFLTADELTRAKRRQGELAAAGQEVDLEQIRSEIARRDQMNQTRAVAPERPAEDAILMDSSALTVDEVVERLMTLLEDC